MVKTNVELPYFDGLLAEFGKGNEQAIAAFGRHVHWGYWDNPYAADGTVADLAAAAESLCRRVCDAGGVDAGLLSSPPSLNALRLRDAAHPRLRLRFRRHDRQS